VWQVACLAVAVATAVALTTRWRSDGSARWPRRDGDADRRTMTGASGCLPASGPESCPWPTPWGLLRRSSRGRVTVRRVRPASSACQEDLQPDSLPAGLIGRTYFRQGAPLRSWIQTRCRRVTGLDGVFADDKGPARPRYEAFVREGLPVGRRPDLVGGGIIRSLGGWAQLLSLRWTRTKVASDARILGSGAFAAQRLAEAGRRETETLRLSRKGVALATLAS
jgi:hypothetical protein